jgi:hypothetical protein
MLLEPPMDRPKPFEFRFEWHARHEGAAGTSWGRFGAFLAISGVVGVEGVAGPRGRAYFWGSKD